MVAISVSRMPRESDRWGTEAAPLVTNGERVSYGTVFLFDGDAGAGRASSSASLPVSSVLRRSSIMR